MASDILQNKTYSHSYYIVANIWHLLIVPKLPFFPPHCGPNHPTKHTPRSSKPYRVSFSPPTGAQTWKDGRIQAQPWNLLWIWSAAGRKAIFERILLLNLLQQGRMCAFLCRVFLLWPRCWPKFHFGSRISNCWVQPANIFWWSNFLPTLECGLNYIWNAGIWDTFTTPQKVRYRILAFPLLFNNGKVILMQCHRDI